MPNGKQKDTKFRSKGLERGLKGMPSYKCPDCDFPPAKWGKLRLHLTLSGHAQAIKPKGRQQALLVQDTTTAAKTNVRTKRTVAKVDEIVWLLRNYGRLDAAMIPAIFKQNFQELICPQGFPNLVSWLSTIPGVIIENETTFPGGITTFVSYDNNAVGVRSYLPPQPVIAAPHSFPMKTAGLDIALFPGEAYDGVQQSYEDMAAETQVLITL